MPVTTDRKILRAAHLAVDYGISVVPPSQDGTKRPGVGRWGQYQKIRATHGQVDIWYAPGLTGLGFVTGYISGGLTVIDFDDRTVYREYKVLAEKCGMGPLIERIENGYMEFSPNGAHWMFRCPKVFGNTKLAQRNDGKALIETRGEGGYIIVAPTFGGVNKGGEYVLKSGGVETIQTITPEEQQELFSLANYFDERKQVEERPSVPHISQDDRPGDDYNNRATWAEVLEPHGWKLLFTQKDTGYWRRPGKQSGSHSGTTGHGGSDFLYVFSTSTGFDSERGYSKFSAYGILNHGSDFESAAKELALLGYGEKTPSIPAGVDISGIVAQAKNRQKKADAASNFPEDLLNVTGAVGEFAAWINETSPKQQPILALGASLAAMSTVCGRKAMSKTGLRSNIYALGVAESGAGKERARECVRSLYAQIGAIEMAAVDALASSAAIESRLAGEPASLFLLDEFGMLLSSINSRRADNHIASMKSVLLRLYGATAGIYAGKAHADSKNDVNIVQPNLSIYGTTTPKLFLSSLSADSINEGLFSRLLVFNSDNPEPPYREIDYDVSVTLPPNVISTYSGWLDRPINVNPSAGNLGSLVPYPLKVPDSDPARAIFEDGEKRMLSRRISLRKDDHDAAAFTRVVTNARKLALIRACGESVTEPEITRDCAEWAMRLSEYLTTSLHAAALDHGSESDAEGVLKAVLRTIKRRGGSATKREVTRSTQRYGKRQRDEAIATLIESGQIVAQQIADGRGSRLVLA